MIILFWCMPSTVFPSHVYIDPDSSVCQYTLDGVCDMELWCPVVELEKKFRMMGGVDVYKGCSCDEFTLCKPSSMCFVGFSKA